MLRSSYVRRTCLLWLLACAGVPGHAANSFEHAQRLREALEGRPEQQRTRREYDRVMDAYRAIYHGNPGSPHADASIAAVADLLAEEGRVFQDEKALRDAIGQDEFLRSQYPGSRYRFSALLTEGEIYERDLGDLNRGKATFREFLKLYPRSPLAEEARSELAGIRKQELAQARGKKIPERQEPGERATSHGHDTVLAAALASKQESGQPAHREKSRTEASTGFVETDIPPPANAAENVASEQPQTNRATAAEEHDRKTENPASVPVFADRNLSEAALNAPPPPRRGSLPLVTGIRHWSTPNYTRVAIDLQDQVQFEAARVPHPDRIFFDLHGARLSPELIGRSVQVTDGGFLRRIRVAQFSNDITRIVLDVSDLSEYSAFFLPNPWRLIIDVHGRAAGVKQPVEVAENTPAPAIGDVPGTPAPDSLAAVATIGSQPHKVAATAHPTTSPVASAVPGTREAPQLRPRNELDALDAEQANNADGSGRPTVDVPPPSAQVAPAAPTATTPLRRRHAGSAVAASPAPVPELTGEPTMVRALGLKINRIVIDAGHGGHDSGTLGPGGIEEKDVVLDVALRLGKLLQRRLGAQVIYTRDDDTFIPLETRTAIANKAQADLFISIHANSSSDPDARGVEVYYLNFTTSADALAVAARENAVSDQSIHQLSDLVKKIALQDKISESREFAEDVDQSLYRGLDSGNPGLKDRGVKKAPFVVLIGANMPSILAEISFLTNPQDAEELREPEYRERIAEALYRGVSRYVGSLNGMRIAESGASTAPGN